jgi:hypothetical protein
MNLVVLRPLAAGCVLSLSWCAAQAFSQVTSGPDHAFYITINGMAPTGINDFLTVAGTCSVDVQVHGCVRDIWGRTTLFDPPHGTIGNNLKINIAGTVAGSFFDSTGASRGFVRTQQGKFESFDPPASINTHVQDINWEGFVTGYYITGTFGIHGFVRDPHGAITSFDAPEGRQTFAYSINAKGAITGDYVASGNLLYVGFVRSRDGTITSFSADGHTRPRAINAAGEIAGFDRGLFSGPAAFFVRSPQGTATQFSLPGVPYQAGGPIVPISINEQGTIAGAYYAISTILSYVRSPKGTITLLDPPGSTQSIAMDINNFGVITGTYGKGSPAQGVQSFGFIRIPLE